MIQDYCAAVHGTLSMESLVAAGTRITATFPFRDPAAQGLLDTVDAPA